jgi:CheY-like chemotaxis protein
MSLHPRHLAESAQENRDDRDHALEAVGLESGTFEAPTEIIRDVLVVEPDPDAQSALSRALALPGRRIVGTSSSEGAYAFVRENAPDAIFIAERIVGMDALDLCAHLRELCPSSLVVWMVEKGTGDGPRFHQGVDLELSHSEILDLPPGTLEYLRLTSLRSSSSVA